MSNALKSVLLLCALLAASLAGGIAAPEEHSHAQPAAEAPILPTPEETRLIALVNAEREKRGLHTLTTDPQLIRIARGHSQEMCDKGYFGHISPTAGLKTPMDRFMKGGGSYRRRLVVGENCYYCSRTNVEGGHAAFMNSPTHRDNVISPDWEQIGVGIYHAPDGRFWATEMFLLKR